MIDYSNSIISILPPLLALCLAIITRKVLLSLGIGIIVGALALGNWEITNSLAYLKKILLNLIYSDNAINLDKAKILMFLFLLGIFTALLTNSGTNQAFANWAKEKIKSKKQAKLLTVALVLVTFIDDYFHSLAVGTIARPVMDKFKVSRAKLAYLLDSTAAPVCVLTPVSSWGASIIATIAGLLVSYELTNYSAMSAFMQMSLMNYYAIFALLLVIYVAYSSFNLGAMNRLEIEAENQEGEIKLIHGKNQKLPISPLIISILILIFATVSAMIWTGAKELETFSILGAFENTNVNTSLVFGGTLGVISALIFTKGKITNYPKTIITGCRSMLGAVLILIFAWLISSVVKDMHTGDYLSQLVAGNIKAQFLPAILFILASLMAFATGTSWGTFGIMLPIAMAIAIKTEPNLVIASMSAVMAGAVCGDHCSPISDTTILSSTGAQCSHIDHVISQIPYVILVALATFAGYLVLGFSQNNLLGFITTAIILVALILLLKKKEIK